MSDPSALTIPSYGPGVAVTVTVPAIDSTGAKITNASAASYRVLDELGTEVQALTAVSGFVANAAQAVITIASALNQLPPAPATPPPGIYPLAVAQLRSMRVVEVHFTTPAGNIQAEALYSITALGAAQLQLMVNSFQTYEEALLETFAMPSLSGWEASSRQQRVQAMSEAYLRLTKLGYSVPHAYSIDSPPAGAGLWPVRFIPPSYWQIMQPAQFNLYAPLFRQCLRRAQVAESNIILGGDPIQQRRDDGLMSESIGESSMMFRPGKPIQLPVSRDAARYLQNYIQFRMTLTRS